MVEPLPPVAKPGDPRAWTLFFQDLERHPPELVIDTASAGYFAFTKFPIEKYPALLRILEQGYERGEVEGFTVWRRLASMRTGPNQFNVPGRGATNDG